MKRPCLAFCDRPLEDIIVAHLQLRIREEGLPIRVWMIRHGESETNKNGLWTGWLDAPLTEEGKRDAALASEFVSRVSFDKIYSSDLLRAKSTAEIVIPGCQYEATPMLSSKK